MIATSMVPSRSCNDRFYSSPFSPERLVERQQ
jgi:hypothetical protein